MTQTKIQYRPRGPARFEHQRRALRRIIETRGRCALLMEPGVGKTAVAIDYASLLALKADRPIRVLVLAPVVALDSWVGQAVEFSAHGVAVWAEALGGKVLQRAEALTTRRASFSEPSEGLRRSIAWAGVTHDGKPVESSLSARRRHWGDFYEGLGVPRPGVVLEVLSLDSLSHKRQVSASRTSTDKVVDAIKSFRPDLVIVDESHRLKSASSNVSRAAARIGKLCPRRLILTGTVMPHSPMDVWGQWRFLEPEAFYIPDKRLPSGRRPMSFGAFQDRYGVFGGWQGRQVIGYKNLGEMQAVMEANSIVVKKADALDLPPVMDVTVPVHLSPTERKVYDDMKDQLATVMSDGTFASVPNRLAQMMRLRQITSGYLPDDNGVTRIIGSSKVDAAISTVTDTLAGQRRVVVFAHFRQEVASLADRLRHDEPKTEVMTITGDTPPREREALRKRFGSDEEQRIVLVAQMRTLSLAVNELVSASHAVFTSLSERRDDVVQARDRLNRLGQTGQSVTFWNVEVPGSVDEVIRKAHLERESIEAALLAYIRGDQASPGSASVS
jgi:hypothetical protein